MMNTQKLKNSIEVATNVAVLVVAVTILSLLAWNFYQGQKVGTQLQFGLQKGSTLAALPGVQYGDSPRTLLIAMTTRCKYCTASVPFYNQLAELEKSKDKSVRIVAVFPDKVDDVDQYVQQKQLGLEVKGAMDLSKLNVAGTPTMILVDSGGKVLDFWVGQLQPDVQQQVIQSLNS